MGRPHPHHDVGVEHRQQRVEVARAGGGEERVDDLALPRRSASGGGSAPRTRRRARLASWRAASGVRSTIGAISSNGTANMSCSTNASRSGGRQRLEHDEQREPDRVGEQRLLLGVGAVVGATTAPAAGRRPVLGRGAARAEHVEADAPDHGRQPAAEVLDPPASPRLSRSHASWTASSASLAEPSIR